MTAEQLQEMLDKIGLVAFKEVCYSYSRNYTYSCILDSCQLESGTKVEEYEFMAAYGAEQLFTLFNPELFLNAKGQWLFGVLSYDLKNYFEELYSSNEEFIKQDEVAFFIPEIVITIDRQMQLRLEKGRLPSEFIATPNYIGLQTKGLTKVNTIDNNNYVSKLKEVKELIRSGIVYELNYCVQHQYTFDEFDPLHFQQKLLSKSPVPMASYFNWGNLFLCGASMERYLIKRNSKIVSQPIKGTIRKGHNEKEDEELKTALYYSVKDRAENVMIVDLVRNDLARISEAGTVHVDELFGIYSYLQLHQMISTISGELTTKDVYTILSASFPMGSMTGAPKVSAMKHIEELENFKRGWYSGALGYIKPNGDFDFNVVIRSLICDKSTSKLVYSAGGAITIDSIAESEWHECLLKTKAIESILID